MGWLLLVSVLLSMVGYFKGAEHVVYAAFAVAVFLVLPTTSAVAASAWIAITGVLYVIDTARNRAESSQRLDIP